MRKSSWKKKPSCSTIYYLDNLKILEKYDKGIMSYRNKSLRYYAHILGYLCRKTSTKTICHLGLLLFFLLYNVTDFPKITEVIEFSSSTACLDVYKRQPI